MLQFRLTDAMSYDMLCDMENTLRVRRAERGGISQRAVARSVRIQPDRYFRIEKDYAQPTEAEVKALARYFRCSASILFPSLAPEAATDGAPA